MAEQDGLENRYTGNRIEGSNPSLTAKVQKFSPMITERDCSQLLATHYRRSAKAIFRTEFSLPEFKNFHLW